MTSAALARTNSMTDSVKERRLRPLYDLLDSGNCKKVLQEADKLLKKHPSFTCAKVFKALAWMRLGKLEDCLATMDQVFEECPIDEGTLHAMSICYRELDMPEKVCILYENANKKEKSEEHMTNWFMAHVRILDFANQNKVATALYKSYSKGMYLMWAAMSLYSKALMLDDQNIAKTITLPLASRMTSKYIAENALCTDNDIYMFITILHKSGDYAQALSVLKNSEDRMKNWSYGHYIRMETLCLKMLKDDNKLADMYERNIIHDSEDLNGFKDYIASFGITKTERIIKFINGIAFAYDPKVQKLQSRITLGALILLTRTLVNNKANLCSIDVRKLYLDYFKLFASKPYFLRDVRSLWKYLRENTNSLEEDMVKNSGTLTNLYSKLQWKSNFECAVSFLNEQDILSHPAKVVNSVCSLVKSYYAADGQYRTSGLEIEVRDAAPYENLLVTSCVLLMKTYWRKQGFWAGLDLNVEMHSLDLDKKEVGGKAVVENGVSTTPVTDKGRVFEGEFAILLTLALLEYGAEHSPYYSAYRLLLGKTYLFCAAAVPGLEQIMKMDIKHMQVDSLGYLYIPKTLRSGIFSDSMRLLIHADALYIASGREVVEHIISAYRNTSWQQVLEFIGYRNQMVCSLQACQVRVEKRLLEYTVDASCREQILKIAHRETVDVKVAFATSFQDNRDLDFHLIMNEDTTSAEYTALTFKDNIHKLRLRTTFLGIITNYVRALSNLNDVEKFNVNIAQACIAHASFTQCMANPPKHNLKNSEGRFLFAPWFPTCDEYVGSPIIICIHDFIELVSTAGELCCQKNSQQDMSKVFALMKTANQSLADGLEATTIHWPKVDISLVNTSNLIEEICEVVETLGFICILLDVLKGFLEKMSPTLLEIKGRKKRSKEPTVVVTDAPWVTQFNSLVNSLISSLSNVDDILSGLRVSFVDRYATSWTEGQEAYWYKMVADEVRLIIEHYIPIVGRKLNDSFLRSCYELKANTQLKKQYAESLVVS